MNIKKIKSAYVFGTRPEAIKMAPVINEMNKYLDYFEPRVYVTAQHREMLDQVLDLFNIKPDCDLNIMQKNQSLFDITINAHKGLEDLLKKEKPDLLLVQGDTTTAFISALSAFYYKIPVGHIEAGLRTDNKYEPYPEEMNRRLISCISDLNFAPTTLAKERLLAEGISPKAIFLTGNTVIDALLHIVKNCEIRLPQELDGINWDQKRVLLVETHRRENLGDPMGEICLALKQVVENFENVEIVFPVHKNPKVRDVVFPVLRDIPNIHLIEPVSYEVLLKLMEKSYFILTDSGGIQEEAPSLGKPVLVLRNNTERPEGITAGVAKLVGTEKNCIIENCRELLCNLTHYEKMKKAINPYGDGKAAERTIKALLNYFGIEKDSFTDFIPKIND